MSSIAISAPFVSFLLGSALSFGRIIPAHTSPLSFGCISPLLHRLPPGFRLHQPLYRTHSQRLGTPLSWKM